ncbi:MAG: response regulator [Bacteroidetes bacterium]|nr:response regulator [Bacteroidota bacterium]
MMNTKENISELLRSVDKLIKAEKFDESLRLVEQILQINGKNIYAKAYKERIEELINERRTKQPGNVIAHPSVPAPMPAQAPEESSVLIPSKYVQKISDAVMEAYKTFLNEIWKDGHITPLEQDRAKSMREFFAISQDEHDYLEQNSRLTCYLNAVRDAWNRGTRDFSAIKELFNVSEQEDLVLEPKVKRLIKSLDSKGVVLSLDDDRNFLLLMERLLEKNGYLCLNTTSGEEALNLLESFSPDIVLCDIAFGQRNMNGFMFYERFRSIERFASVPFIFISALNQKELIRTGKKLGVDDYLTKPVENDVLLAAIEGKIRRTREMKKAVDY